MEPEPIPLGVAFVVGPLMMFAGGLLAFFADRCRRGDIARNTRLGIRIPATLGSDHAWATGHRAAAPWLFIAASGPLVSGVITLFRPSSETMALSIMVGLGVMVGLVAVATAIASMAASAPGRR